MGNTVSQSNDDYPNLQQRIITYPTDDDENQASNTHMCGIRRVKHNVKELSVPIYVYPKTISITFKNKLLHIHFKYRSFTTVKLDVYLALQIDSNKLPSLTNSIYTCELRDDNAEFSSQPIKIDSERYEMLFYNSDKNYIPIAIALGKEQICYLIYGGFHPKTTSEEMLSCGTTCNYIVVDSLIYEIKEVYGTKSDNGDVCCICLSGKRNVITIPCYHCCICTQCSKNPCVKKSGCPICRSSINGFIEID
ncbi:hypothetical protein BMR1_03g01535 [Babesia microti strain RI]|uniref:RING-type domain-containing protein n=1 Tax=Babesia microti (strain RI) TaxID=1133968 RepID=A0A1R4ABN7_BABMR|nr:hypothetical protein BMR1_03g01535 [Babesia microti strain RI]SJK86355.1 hypothetical protein BMR1_03g01535 [Babesia microti strain RI]|eukprot:XP_021338522.1 hypothetical protein BMR1_03g01535 [Babesia microti strain RI]